MNQVLYDKEVARTEVYGKATEELARAQMLLPEDVAVQIALGRLAMLGGKRADAIAAYRAALSHDPKNISAMLGLAQALNADGQVDAAITTYKQAAELAPLPVDSLMRLAALYRKTESYAPAIAALEEAVALRPDGKRAWRDLGDTYVAAQQPDAAITAYKHVLDIDDQDARTHEALATLYEAKNACADAIEHRARLLEFSPNAWAHILLGQNYLACRQPELAQIHFQAAIAMKPNIPHAHYWLGLAFEALAKPSEAQAAFTQTLEVANNPFWINRAQKKLEQIASNAGASESTP
jgi:tetratricopeptide (TPR) repeat protein